MGLFVSIDSNKIPKEWMEMFSCMKLKRTEVKKLHGIFDAVDVKQIGGINIVQWLTLFDLERNHFTERIFWAFDKDGNKHIDFYEFVISLWKFCSLGEGAISKLFLFICVVHKLFYLCTTCFLLKQMCSLLICTIRILMGF